MKIQEGLPDPSDTSFDSVLARLEWASGFYAGWYSTGMPKMDGGDMAYELATVIREVLARLREQDLDALASPGSPNFRAWAQHTRRCPKGDERVIVGAGDNADETRCTCGLDAALSSGPPSSTEPWQPIATAPKDGMAFRAYGPELIHPDFNPWGSTEACFDGARFVGAVWDGQFDAWNTVEIVFTHWQPLPSPPVVASSRSEEGLKVEDMRCPWCGDTLNYLKPAGGCLIADIHGYGWHARCADEYEAAKDPSPAEEGIAAAVTQLQGYMQHKPECERLRILWSVPIISDGRCGGLRTPTTAEREEHDRNRKCTCGLDDRLAALLGSRSPEKG